MFAIRSLFAALRPQVPSGALGRGLRAIEEGRFEEAQQALAAALAEAADAPSRARVHNKLGVAYMASGRRAEATAAFACALESDSASAPALTNIGNVLLEDGDTLDAIDYYRAAVSADERYAPAHRNLGIALRRAGRRSQSVSALRTADRLEARPRRSRA